MTAQQYYSFLCPLCRHPTLSKRSVGDQKQYFSNPSKFEPDIDITVLVGKILPYRLNYTKDEWVMNSFATQQITQVIQLFSTFELNFI